VAPSAAGPKPALSRLPNKGTAFAAPRQRQSLPDSADRVFLIEKQSPRRVHICLSTGPEKTLDPAPETVLDALAMQADAEAGPGLEGQPSSLDQRFQGCFD